MDRVTHLQRVYAHAEAPQRAHLLVLAGPLDEKLLRQRGVFAAGPPVAPVTCGMTGSLQRVACQAASLAAPQIRREGIHEWQRRCTSPPVVMVKCHTRPHAHRTQGTAPSDASRK